jgi:hypothetical protein
LHAPVIEHPDRWLRQTRLSGDLAQPFFASLSIDRETARAELSKKLDDQGFPFGPALFHRYPFVKFPDGSLVAASPWAVEGHLKTGVWAAHLQAAKGEYGDSGPQRWFSAFGDQFEAWCRRIAEVAARGDRFRGRIVTSAAIGIDEIEDVVLLEGNIVVLFSAKASLVPVSALREARSTKDVVQWYHRFLLETGDQQYRGGRGALKLLDEKCSKLRRGDYEPHICKHATILPVVVTYDDIGDNPGAYIWTYARCNELKLFKQPRVRAPTFMSIPDFERLMGAGFAGHSITRILEGKTQGGWAKAPFSVLFRERVPNAEDWRLPDLQARYDDIVDRICKGLFGRGTLEE